MKLKSLAPIGWLFATILQLHAQGYIVPNGVIDAGINGITVMYDPTNSYYTGFRLFHEGGNTFQFDAVTDVSVRVFLVSPNDPISLQPILAHNYTELATYTSYVFNSGVPFYVGLYTGNQEFHPPNGIYNDPLFGWAQLVNYQGTIYMLGSALEYQGGGIYAGTQNIIPVPEPSVFGLFALGALLFGWRFLNLREPPNARDAPFLNCRVRE